MRIEENVLCTSINTGHVKPPWDQVRACRQSEHTQPSKHARTYFRLFGPKGCRLLVTSTTVPNVLKSGHNGPKYLTGGASAKCLTWPEWILSAMMLDSASLMRSRANCDNGVGRITELKRHKPDPLGRCVMSRPRDENLTRQYRHVLSSPA